jgi:uncharacterized protein YjbI with pentapeptide repeats
VVWLCQRIWLTRARIGAADLSGRDLSEAHLVEADLRGADLSRADLTGAWLIRADLDGARLDRTRLADADLDGLRGTPDVVSIDTGSELLAGDRAVAWLRERM